MLHHKGTQWLHTERLRLAPLTARHAEEMFYGWAGDDETTKFLPWPVHGDLEVTKKILSDWEEKYTSTRYYNWGIFLKENGRLIGTISFVDINDYKCTAEIGYVIANEYRNKGYASEAAKRLLDYGFDEIGFKRIVGYHFINNDVSGKVMEKIGMKREGWLPKSKLDNKGRVCDVIQYAASRSENKGEN